MTDPARVIEAMPDGLFVVDRTRTITFWNGAAARITGYSEENAVGRRWGKECSTTSMNPVVRGTHCPLLATMQDGKTRSTRAYAHHRDGHLVPVRVTASVGATLSREIGTPESLVSRADRAR